MSATPDRLSPGDIAALLADARLARLAAERDASAALRGDAVGQILDELADALAVMGNQRDHLERRDVVRWLRGIALRHQPGKAAELTRDYLARIKDAT